VDGAKFIERVHKRGALVKVLDRDYLDLTKPINRGNLAFLSAPPRTSGIASWGARTRAPSTTARSADLQDKDR
jgi:hypothetical protein